MPNFKNWLIGSYLYAILSMNIGRQGRLLMSVIPVDPEQFSEFIGDVR